MALLTEDGTEIAGAESLCSVSVADTYLAARGFTLWATMSTTGKEQALRRATDHIEQVYRDRWAGYRVTTTQALSWPRIAAPIRDAVGVYFRNAGSYYASNTVPTIVQQACALLAFKGAAGDLSPDIDRVVAKEKIGQIETEYERGRPAYTRFRAIDNMLAPFMKAGGGSSISVVRS